MQRRHAVSASAVSASTVAALCGGLVLLLAPALVDGATNTVPAATTARPDAVVACERAARQALGSRATPADDVVFDGAPQVEPGDGADGPLVLRGAATTRGAGGVRQLVYSCSVDPRSARSVGLVIRDARPAAAAPATARFATDAELGQLSPSACESSAVRALQGRWPRVSQIAFDSATRTLLQKGVGRAELHGHGRALPQPGAPSTHFGFECEVNTRDGKVLGMRLSG